MSEVLSQLEMIGLLAKLLCNTWAIGGIDPAEQVQMPWVDKDTSLP